MPAVLPKHPKTEINQNSPKISWTQCWVSFFLILPAFCTKLFSYFSFSGCFEFSTSAKFTPFTQWVQHIFRTTEDFHGFPAFHGFQICWGAGQHPQNHLPSVHAVRTPQVSKCLQDAPTIYAARPRKTCLCDQDNEHTLLQPFWRQLQAWQEPTNLVASQHLLPLPVYIENYWNISQFLATLSPCQWPQHPKGTEALWSTLENLWKWKRSQTMSNAQRMHREKSKQVQNSSEQAAPRCSKML